MYDPQSLVIYFVIHASPQRHLFSPQVPEPNLHHPFARELSRVQPKLVRYCVREKLRTLPERKVELVQLRSALRSNLEGGQPRRLVFNRVGVVRAGELLEFRADFGGG